MNVYEVITANGGNTTIVLVEARHIRFAVRKAVQRQEDAPRDTYLKVLARRVAVNTTLAQYRAAHEQASA